GIRGCGMQQERQAVAVQERSGIAFWIGECRAQDIMDSCHNGPGERMRWQNDPALVCRRVD
ncbi:MAG: hypothetical protein M3O46_12245, partial [Myxococcota bacterium]|nr:hypothetical protein [Myxococcota bacterium]